MTRTITLALAVALATGCDPDSEAPAVDVPSTDVDTLVTGTIDVADAHDVQVCVLGDADSCIQAYHLAPVHQDGAGAPWLFQIAVRSGSSMVLEVRGDRHLPAIVAVGQSGGSVEMGQIALLDRAELDALVEGADAEAGHIMVRVVDQFDEPLAGIAVDVAAQAVRYPGRGLGDDATTARGLAVAPDLAAGAYVVTIEDDEGALSCRPDSAAGWSLGSSQLLVPVEDGAVSQVTMVCD
jgi:hypothetical protein